MWMNDSLPPKIANKHGSKWDQNSLLTKQQPSLKVCIHVASSAHSASLCHVLLFHFILFSSWVIVCEVILHRDTPGIYTWNVSTCVYKPDLIYHRKKNKMYTNTRLLVVVVCWWYWSRTFFVKPIKFSSLMEYSTLLLHIGSSLCSIIACGVLGLGMFMKLPPFISACKDSGPNWSKGWCTTVSFVS